MRRIAQLSTGIVILSAAIVPGVAAAEKNIFEKFGDAVVSGFNTLFGAHQTPATDKLKPRLTPPQTGVALDPVKFYRVDMNCSINANTAKLITEGLVVKQSTFVAHTLWFSPSAASGAIPTNPSKLVTVFSFQKDATGTIQDFTNETCSETFWLSGKDSVLTVAFSMTDTSTLSGFSQLIYDGAKILVGFAPLLFSGPLGASITAAATAAQGAKDPLKDAIEAMNKDGRRVAVPINLLASDKPTTVRTEYSRINLTVTEVTDIAGQILGDPKLRESAYSAFDAVADGFFKSASDDPAKIKKCAEFSEKMGRYYRFTNKDKSFFAGYVAQQVFPSSISGRLDCIGNRFNANDIIDYKFPYNVDTLSFRALTAQAIGNHFAGKGFSRELIDSDFAYSYSTRLSNLLSSFSKTDDVNARKPISDALAKHVGAKLVDIDDESTSFYLNSSNIPFEDILANLNKKGFKRFGCFATRPTVGIGGFDVIILGFPLVVPAGRINNKYDLDDLVGLRLVIDSSGTDTAVIKKIQLTTDELAVEEPEKRFKGKCPIKSGVNLLE